MSVSTLREFINRHTASITGLAALGAALDAKVTGQPLEGPLGERIGELLTALGAEGLLADVSAQEALPLLAELRVVFALDAKLLHTERRVSGWRHTEPEVLQAAGDTSAGFVQMLARGVVPQLDGLSARFECPDATFLDVGVGVASLSIAVAQKWPALQIVGIDLWQPSLELARENIARAKLGQRIELREQRAQDLNDDARFDLAWFPTVFVPAPAVRPACESIVRALRPGGWLLFIALNPNADALGTAVWRLRMAVYGNVAMPTSSAAESLLRELGLAEVKTLPSQPGAFMSVVVGRRPLEG
ncbi:MAG: class I SAM-dependent methyltransferase [Deltaproteobacteria bacterium]